MPRGIGNIDCRCSGPALDSSESDTWQRTSKREIGQPKQEYIVTRVTSLLLPVWVRPREDGIRPLVASTEQALHRLNESGKSVEADVGFQRRELRESAPRLATPQLVCSLQLN